MRIKKLTYACPGTGDGLGTLFTEICFGSDCGDFYILGLEHDESEIFEFYRSKASIFDMAKKLSQNAGEKVRLIIASDPDDDPKFTAKQLDIKAIVSKLSDNFDVQSFVIPLDEPEDSLHELTAQDDGIAYLIAYEFISGARMDVEWFADEEEPSEESTQLFYDILFKYEDMDEMDPEEMMDDIF